MSFAVSTEGLVKRYGASRALDGFSLSVPRGSVTGLVGSNGAGKTTWMMTVAGFVVPDSGSVDVLGGGPFDASVHSGRVSILPQDSELPPESRVGELLVRYGRLQGLSREAAAGAAASLLSAFNLVDRARSRVRSLSHGMRKRVMAAQAFIGSPELVLLDEPMGGLDPVEIARMRDFITARRGRQTIVISSHNLDDIQKLCTHVAFVEHGRLTRTDTLESITLAGGRVVYVLRRPPDVSALGAAMPDIGFNWRAPALECEFADGVAVEDMNARLLPALLPFGVVSVSPGRTLERVYLEGLAASLKTP